MPQPLSSAELGCRMETSLSTSRDFLPNERRGSGFTESHGNGEIELTPQNTEETREKAWLHSSLVAKKPDRKTKKQNLQKVPTSTGVPENPNPRWRGVKGALDRTVC